MTKEEIISSTTMSDVMSRYGIRINNSMCRCPFHDDKTPSMKVYETSAYCFTCGRSWDLFSFIQDKDGVSFKEAFISLGGTYKHENTAAGRFKVAQERERRKAEAERIRQEDRRRFKEVSKALIMCEIGAEIYEPYSDEWCFYVNNRTYMRYVFDALFLDQTEEYDLNVHRKCRDIITR